MPVRMLGLRELLGNASGRNCYYCKAHIDLVANVSSRGFTTMKASVACGSMEGVVFVRSGHKCWTAVRSTVGCCGSNTSVLWYLVVHRQLDLWTRYLSSLNLQSCGLPRCTLSAIQIVASGIGRCVVNPRLIVLIPDLCVFFA